MFRMRPLCAALVALAIIGLACAGAAPTPTKPPALAATPTTAAIAQPSPTPLRGAPVAPATAAPAPTATPRVATSRGKIVFANITDIGATQELTGVSPDRRPYMSSVSAGLTAWDMEGNPIPWVAKSWELLEGGKVITFTLRDDVYFHDGTKVTVDDWVWRINDTWLRPRPEQKRAPVSRPPVPEKAEKIDSSRFRIIWPAPDPLFFGSLTMTTEWGFLGVYPKAYVERVGFEEFAKKPIGAGPYKFVSWSPLEKVVVEAQDKFFNGPPPVKTIEMLFVPEDTTRVAMLLAGEADIAIAMAPQFLPRLERQPGIKLWKSLQPQEATFHFHTNHKTIPGTDLPNPFRDVRVRRAVAHAIDKDAILKNVVGRAGTAAKGPWSKNHLGWDGDNIVDYEYNPKKARQLLEEANFPFRIPFKLWAYKLSSPMPEAFQAVANYLNEVGMKVEYSSMETGTFFAQWTAMRNDRTVSALYPMSMVRHYTDKNPLTTLQTHFDIHGNTLADPKLDATVNEALSTADPKGHEEILKKLYRYMHEQVHVIDLYAQIEFHGLGPRVDWSFPPGNPTHMEYIQWRPGYP